MVPVMVNRMETMLEKARVAKMCQLRHVLCFIFSMLDVVTTTFIVARWPHSFHLYYSFKVGLLITFRLMYYRWKKYHLFLIDLCYIINCLVMMHIWLFPQWQWLNDCVHGFGGMLFVCIPLFRNSFVPHSLDRITSLQVHLMPQLQLYILRWHKSSEQEQAYASAEDMSILPAVAMYLLWACIYHGLIFFVWGKYISEGRLATLFWHMYGDMNLKKYMPRGSTKAHAKTVFVLGHACVFIMGIPHLYLPHAAQLAALLFALTWGFRNGASFYIMYFWKVYDQQIHDFEREMMATQMSHEVKSYKRGLSPVRSPSRRKLDQQQQQREQREQANAGGDAQNIDTADLEAEVGEANGASRRWASSTGFHLDDEESPRRDWQRVE